MRALIFDDKVVQVEPLEFEVAPGMMWVECPNDCAVGWRYIDGVLLPPEPPTQKELLEEYIVAIEQLLDSTAVSRQYDSAISIISYAGSGVLPWKEEANVFIAWRDSVYQSAIKILDEVKKGLPAPTIQQMLDVFPKIAWP